LAPDLAVEVVSPWDRDRHLNQKINEYFAAGTRLLWVVYPDTQTVYVYRSPHDVRALDENGELDGEDVLPRFTCPVRRCFA
jgi:Uma2 family endonuclease